MIIGACIGPNPDTVKIVKDIGFRYVEIGLRGVYGDNEKNLVPFLKSLDENKIRCEAANCPFPGVYDPSGRQSEQALYNAYNQMYDLIKKTSAVGIERLIIGAGGARVLPSPDKYANVMEQMTEICLRAIVPVCSEFGIIAVLEGLRKTETTMLNTTAQSVELAGLVNSPNLMVMADSYHVVNEGENFADFKNYRGFIHHSHIGKPDPRNMPDENDGYDYGPFFAALRSAGFNGRMSAEARVQGEFKPTMENAYKLMSKYA